MSAEPRTVEETLNTMLQYHEVLGVVAVSVDGLVVGAAGVETEDAEILAALGASLVGVAERTSKRLGADAPNLLCVGAGDGMVHVRARDDFALVVITERCDATLVSDAADMVLAELAITLGQTQTAQAS